VTIFNLSFKLDGKSINNPITQAIKGVAQTNIA
jgi:hypothetical protein